MLEFGPDGYLYIGLGDGGPGGDPNNMAQNGMELLGKILRIDVDNGLPYSIPPTNPFIGDPNTLDEIWATGLRNPWRFSFDRLTGDLYIGDVGQWDWEEINFEPAGSPGGRNYGWRLMEGTHCYNPSSGCNPGGTLELPIHEYQHFPNSCAIIGGVVYRGRSMARMHGRYFFADLCEGNLRSFRYDPQTGIVSDYMDHLAELGYQGVIWSINEDADGEIYFSTKNEVYRVVPAGFVLDIPNLFGGQSATGGVRGGIPNAPAYIGMSRVGLGSTNVPPLGVVADLAGPSPLATLMTDANGDASLTATTPPNLTGHTIWFQAVQQGQTSNVVMEEIE